MRSSEMLRSVFGLASAVTLNARNHKQLPLTEALGSKWQCSPSLLNAGALRILAWMFSEQGRAIVAATIAAVGVLSLLYWHSLPEARELAIAIVALLAFLDLLRTSNGGGHRHSEMRAAGNKYWQPLLTCAPPPRPAPANQNQQLEKEKKMQIQITIEQNQEKFFELAEVLRTFAADFLTAARSKTVRSVSTLSTIMACIGGRGTAIRPLQSSEKLSLGLLAKRHKPK